MLIVRFGHSCSVRLEFQTINYEGLQAAECKEQCGQACITGVLYLPKSAFVALSSSHSLGQAIGGERGYTTKRIGVRGAPRPGCRVAGPVAPSGLDEFLGVQLQQGASGASRGPSCSTRRPRRPASMGTMRILEALHPSGCVIHYFSATFS